MKANVDEFAEMVYNNAAKIGYSWDMTVRIKSNNKLERVVSTSHPVNVQLN